jgi:hypothetical protein
VNVDFFRDIWVPFSGLFPGSELCVITPRFCRTDQDPSRVYKLYNSFVWSTDGGEPYEFEKSERVRFRVESEVWQDQTPRKFRRDEERPDELVGIRKDAPYTIIVSPWMVCLLC